MNHLQAPSMLTIIPLQDWFALSDMLKRMKDVESERINMPVNPRHYWRYRMHISLEQLLQANDLNQKIHEMIDNSGR
jgi:4-alpha-glucanotransferase